MKKNYTAKIILSVLLLVGVVGGLAAITKGFSEFPEIIVHSEEVVQHEGGNNNSSISNDDPITATEVSEAVDFNMTLYQYNVNYPNSYSSGEFCSSFDNDNFIFDVINNDFNNEDDRWAVELNYILKTGKIKKYYCGMDNSSMHSISYEYPDNLAKEYLLCFSKNGGEPDLENDFQEIPYTPDGGWKKLKVLDYDLGFKFYIYGSDKAQFLYDILTVSANDGNTWSKDETRTSYHYDDVNYKYIKFSYNTEDKSQLNFSMNLNQKWTDNIDKEFTFENVVSLDVSDYDSVLITYSNNGDDYEPIDYDELVDEIVIPNGDFIGKLFVHVIYHIDNPEPSNIPTELGIYKIKLTRNDIISINNNGTILFIDTDDRENDDNDTLFSLLSVVSSYNDQVIDEWNDGGCHCESNYGNSLEIWQDGSSIESEIFGKNDNNSGSAGWYIDGFLTPSEINYTLEIMIRIVQIGRETDFTDAFLAYFEKVDDLTPGMVMLELTRDDLNTDSGLHELIVETYLYPTFELYDIDVRTEPSSHHEAGCYWGYYQEEDVELDSELYLDNQQDSGYFEFGTDNFCNNYSITVPYEENYLVTIFVYFYDVGSEDAYTNLFNIGFNNAKSV